MSDRPILNALTKNRPVIGAVAGAIIDRAVEKVAEKRTNTLTEAQAPAVAQDLKAEVGPVIQNALNKEPLPQSRIFTGTNLTNLGLFLMGLQVIAMQLGWKTVAGFLNTEFIYAVVNVVGIGSIGMGQTMVLLGRVRSGLKPLEGWNPLRWLGLKR